MRVFALVYLEIDEPGDIIGLFTQLDDAKLRATADHRARGKPITWRYEEEEDEIRGCPFDAQPWYSADWSITEHVVDYGLLRLPT